MSSSASKKKTIGTFQVICYIKYNMNKGNKKKITKTWQFVLHGDRRM